MRFGKLLLMTAFVLSSVGIGVSAAAGPASASPAPAGAGTLTCAVGGSVYFNPPLTQYGTITNGPGYNHEFAYFQLGLTGCTGPGSDTPQPKPTAATVMGSGKVHLKNERVPFNGGMVKVMGACGGTYFPPSQFKITEIWEGGSRVARSHPKLSVSVTGGRIGGTSKGSYPGSASGTLNLTAGTSDEYDSVCNGDGDGSISQLSFDPSTSSVTIG